MNDSAFKRVTRQHPCVCCKKFDWCGYTEDGVWAVCMRTESGKATRNGGWLHRLKDAPPPPMRPRVAPPARPKLMDAAKYHAALRKAWRPEDGALWAERLGVWEYALEALQPAWDAANEALAFPMRDAAGAVVGIRLRNAEGKKWAVRGGADGLFYAPEMTADDLVICEGPTDTAAALSLDLPAVGRPSCSSGVAALSDLAKRLRARTVTIIADHDAPHERADGSAYLPGLDGARKLGQELRRMYRIIIPPAKDMRAWFASGALTRAHFDSLAKSAKWRMA